MSQHNIFMTLGATSHTDKNRQMADYYATDPKAVDLLLFEGNAPLSHAVWECACGEGHLAKRLEALGYEVKATDLIDRGYGIGNCDFLSSNERWCGDILTNPPFKLAQDFIEHGLSLISDGNHVYMFLKIQFLEGRARKQFFKDNPPKTVYVFSGRILCAKNGDFETMEAAGGSALAYAWYEWEKGWHGDTIVKWIN